MKRTGIIVVVVIVFLLFFGFQWGISTGNKMVTMDESVAAAWSQVENVYQRRSDLIPNLVSTVKGYADFEKSTLTEVIEARAKATQVTVDPTKLTPEALQQFQQAQGGLSSALGRLMVVVEKYPDLKANESFLNLQAQLEGTENRITVERMKFNEVARGYNTYIRQFPQSIIASMRNFEKKAYFEAEKGADKAPKVQF
ncbi:MAG TPA: LemA family protein [Prolixibacteraceae bacterium]|nr:LemA family protein [Prolixibacteraceae bacterium]